MNQHANNLCPQLQDAYWVLSDPDERAVYDGQVFRSYQESLRSRTDSVAACLTAKSELDTAQEARLLALKDFEQHLQTELHSVGQIVAASGEPSLGLSLSDGVAYSGRALDQAKKTFQVADAQLREAQACMNAADRNLDENTTHYQTLRYEYTGKSEFGNIGPNLDSIWDTADDRIQSLSRELERTKAEIGMITLKQQEKELEAATAELRSVREELQRFKAANAAYAAREMEMRDTEVQLRATKAKLRTADDNLDTARAQLFDQEEMVQILKAENKRLKQAMADYVDNMSKIEDSIKKARHSTCLLPNDDKERSAFEEAIDADIKRHKRARTPTTQYDPRSPKRTRSQTATHANMNRQVNG
ncbi:hypothetical protein QBC40DRAFT_183518 [Triangularia verruculosa]|uniref:Uncharacterized protein n=1 Tax=Triangularia verruculosa TaxID=2587418 RepID=A0AAN6XAF8_9PEZI|nr:hypothetical protein QBC40DRAFT_183518 [Triangularia verruculosa]